MKYFILLFLSGLIWAQETGPIPVSDTSTGKYGLKDAYGNWISPLRFDKLQKLNPYFYSGEISSPGSFIYRLDPVSKELIRINYRLPDTKLYSEQFVIIQQYGSNGPKGVMDINGKEILPTFYSNLWIKDTYFLGELNNQVYIYNPKGEKVFPQPFKYVEIKNGFIYVKTEDTRFPNKEKYIVYNRDLQPITQENWTIEGQFGKDLLLLVKTLDNQHFFINEEGKVLIKYNPKINYESPFSNGFAVISSRNTPKKFGFINTQGKIAIPMEYSETAPFQEKYAYFSKEENGIFTEGLIDPENRIIKIFPAKVISKSVYYDSNETTYYLANLETYDADGNFKEDTQPIQ